MVSVASQPPVRQTSGATTDPAWGPLADDGTGNPFFYHAFQDDFDNALGTGATGLYTITAASGSVAHTAGDGGLALFTTGATAALFAEIQLPAASFTLALPKKLFFLTRLQLSDVLNSGWVAGLVNTNTTPFTGGITDGIYFTKASGSAQIVLNCNVGGVNVTLNVPFTLANATFFDIGFYLTRLGDIVVFAASQLVGFIPQSGSGTLTPPQPGPLVRMTAPALTAVNLNLTAAVLAGTASAKTMTVDFHLAHKER